MTRKEAAGVIKFEKACVLRQDTPRCNRDCKKCDLLLPTEDVLTAYDMAIKALEQEPKTGHWITKDDKEQGYDIGGVKTWYIQIMCSECGFIKTAIEGHTWQYHYCPNCGAKMIEPQESEEK